MIPAHVGGLPLEEALLPLAGVAGTGLLLTRAWIGSRRPFRRDRHEDTGARQDPDPGARP